MSQQFSSNAEFRLHAYKEEALNKLAKNKANKQMLPYFTESQISILMMDLFDRIESLENELNERRATEAFRR